MVVRIAAHWVHFGGRTAYVRRALSLAAVQGHPHGSDAPGRLHHRRRRDRRAPHRAAQRSGAAAGEGHRGLCLLHLADCLFRAADAAPAAQIDRDLPRQPAAHTRRALRRRDPARRQWRELVDQSRRDRRRHRPVPRAARSARRQMKNRTLPAMAVVILVLGALELFQFRLLQPLENRLLDRFVRSQAARLAPDPDIVLVDIDEKSLANMQKEAGRWPWPRVVHADLVEGLATQKPRAIVFDLMFTEADQFRPRDDAAFAETVSQHPNTYFPLLRLPARDDARGDRIADIAGLLGIVKARDADPEARVALIPPRVLPREHWRTGLITFSEDDDGVGRRYLLREVINGWQIPSLPTRVAFDLGFPVPDADDIVLAWRGQARAFPRVSYSDLYEDFNRSQRTRPPDEFTGKIVIIGTGATGLQDLRVTPLDSLHPGAEILGTAIENLKNGRAMRYAPTWWPTLAGALLIFLIYLGFKRNVDARVVKRWPCSPASSIRTWSGS